MAEEKKKEEAKVAESNPMIVKGKEIRQKLDGFCKKYSNVHNEQRFVPTQYDKNIPQLLPHPLLAEAFNLVEKSRMWIGKALGFIGEPYPYPTDGTVVLKTDTVKEEPGNFGESTKVEIVSEMRNELQSIIDVLPDNSYKPLTRDEARSWTNAWNYLVEAKFSLGQYIAENGIQGTKEKRTE